MHKGRVEAFSDGVIAILITILVLELKLPHGHGFSDLQPMIPVFLGYVLSFLYLGIYWNNHHHLFQAVHTVNGKVLWANLHLLFWLSLIPFATGWMTEDCFQTAPIVFYGGVLNLAGVAYTILSKILVQHHGTSSVIGKAIGSDFKGKLSAVLYLVALAVAFIETRISLGIYVFVAMMWLAPDRRIEKILQE